MIRKMKKTSRLLPDTGRSQATNLKTQKKKVDRSAPITSKEVFPKRSAKMLDVTEKPKIPVKFAKCAARYLGIQN